MSNIEREWMEDNMFATPRKVLKNLPPLKMTGQESCGYGGDMNSKVLELMLVGMVESILQTEGWTPKKLTPEQNEIIDRTYKNIMDMEEQDG